MKNSIKLIAIDFDGTFLDDDHFKKDLSLVDKIRKANISQEIVFASGRGTYGIIELLNKLGIKDMVRYVIGHNGAQIYDLKNEKSIYEKKIDTKTYLEISNFILDKGYINPIAMHNWECLYTLNYDKIVEIENLVNFTTSLSIKKLEELKNTEELKLMIFTYPNQIDDIYNLIDENFKNSINQARSGKEIIEITSKGVSKASALRYLCNKLGISMKEVLAFGNAENDLEMIQEVGYGYAMKNSDKHLLSVAKNFTKYTNNENGVELEIIDILDIK